MSILSVMAAAVMLSACGDADDTADIGDALPAVGTLKLNNSAAISETTTESETTTISETTTTISETTTTLHETTTISETTTTLHETTTISETTTTISETTTTLPETTTTLPETTTTLPETTTTLPVTTTAKKDFSGESAVKIIYGGKCVALDGITDVKQFFGKPASPEISAPSCLGEGEDIVYIYSDFTVSAFAPAGGKPRVVSIISTGKSIGNPRGVTVGASEKSALAALGGDSLEENGATVSFFAENGVVTEVDYIITI